MYYRDIILEEVTSFNEFDISAFKTKVKGVFIRFLEMLKKLKDKILQYFFDKNIQRSIANIEKNATNEFMDKKFYAFADSANITSEELLVIGSNWNKNVEAVDRVLNALNDILNKPAPSNDDEAYELEQSGSTEAFVEILEKNGATLGKYEIHDLYKKFIKSNTVKDVFNLLKTGFDNSNLAAKKVMKEIDQYEKDVKSFMSDFDRLKGNFDLNEYIYIASINAFKIIIEHYKAMLEAAIRVKQNNAKWIMRIEEQLDK